MVEPVPALPVQPTGCDLVAGYDWDAPTARAICMAESGGNTMAANMNDNHGSCVGSYGFMQIACIHGGVFYDSKQNMAKAFEIYNRSGWTPWGAHTITVNT